MRAIYRCIPLSKADQQETLIYNLGDGFCWVKNQDPNNKWKAYCSTAVEAEQQARQAGFDPQAVAYLGTK